ncbi:TSUP family transporter [Burkholderia sp. Cy-637]|uniref:TSUP family transporter n=1 Tax=Burkholderia sp. Cy-637 TaxID=2608327 RepID=UPI00142088DD|nr:TSUP family transporter [Burkholderia sp. Cy-637]NIF90220.1 TSUP family transporter [Burkholderia sp. Cy-637]
MHDPYLLAGIVALLAVVQSIFGMGVLVFGTPTLLLLGFDFTSVLGLLLPSSMAISAIQVATGRGEPLPARERINMLFCALAIVAALAVLVATGLRARVEILIGLMMLGAAVIRYSPRLQARLQRFVQRRDRAYAGAMGVIHGLTNMGGALLAVYAVSRHQDKLQVRLAIARYYLLFGALQLGTLSVLRRSALSVEGFAIAPLAVVVYFAVGNLLFKRAGAPLYERAMTAFIGVYGAVVLARTLI